MPPRPVLKPKQNRPSSAIYLGSQADLVHSPVSIANTSTPPSLPSLPEPPSPSTSIGSTGSGLPSPPATNSTGSGSTGDPASISRKHNISIISLNSSTSSSGSGYNVFGSAGSDNTINAVPRGGTIGSAAKAAHRSSMGALVVGGGGGRASRSSSRMGDDTDDDGLFDDPNDKSFHDNDEDNTARVAHDHRRQSQQPLNKSSSENIIALERVKSLTQRNRLALDKLTSIRLNSPSPHPNARSSTPLLSTSRSTLPPSSSQASASASATSATSATSSHASLSSSSRLSQSSQPQTRQSVRAPPIDRQLSGSETEREGEGSVVYSQYTHTSSASSSSSSHVHIYSLNDGITNPAGNGGRSTPPSAYTSQFQKMRLSSAPATPNKSRLASSSSNHSASSPSPSSSSASRRRKRASMLASMSTSSLVEYVGPDPGPGRGDDRELGQEHVPATTDDEEDYYYDRQSTVSGATSGGDSRDRNRDRDRDRDKDKDRGRDNTLVRRLSRTGSNEIDKSREITEAALAAVASSRRRSPVDTRKPRGALPREFRDPANTSVASLASANAGGGNERSTGRSSLDGSNSGRSGHSNEPQTPHRRERRLQQHAQSILYSPSAKQQRTRSTVRDRDRDRERDAYSRAASRLGYDDDESYRDEEGFGGGEQEPPPRRESHREKRERRQGVRAGSAESALALGLPAAATAGGGAGRSLVGEGLRAAGLKRRDAAAGHTSSRSIRLNGDDVFRSEDEARDVGKERERERKGDWSRAGTVSARARAATSMGEYRYIDSGRGVEDDEEDGLRSAPLKSKKSAYRLASIARDRSPMQVGDREKEREVDRSVSVLGMRRDRDRYSSPSGPRRPAPLASTTRGGAAPAAPATTTPTSASALLQQQQQQSLEHARLMMDSLVMFESHVTKLAGLNPSAQADLVRTAQSVALSVEKLNGLMRNGNVRALEEQIDAEVNSSGGEGAMDSAEMWRKVGSDYREGLRCSDDLIRGVTSLLLGVGKILRDHTGGGGGAAGSGGSDAGSHGRSVSLDEEFGVVVRRTPDGVVGGSLNDRENRRSWDLVRDREDVLKRYSARTEGALARRSGSAFNTLRDPDLVNSRIRDSPSPMPPVPTTRATAGALQRARTPRDRELLQERGYEAVGMVASDSQRTLQPGDYDPSPTPMSRFGPNTERLRPLPALSIPKKAPSTLSSERRSNATEEAASTTSSHDRERHDRERRQPSTHSINSIATIRGAPPSLPSLTSAANPTTALTTHIVSNSPPLNGTFYPPLYRNGSAGSGHSSATGPKSVLPSRSSVTFSRPSTISVSALSGLQQQDMDSRIKRMMTGGDGASVTTNESAGSGKGSGSASVSVSISGRSRLGMGGGTGTGTGTATGTVTPVSRNEAEGKRRPGSSKTMRASLDDSQLGGDSEGNVKIKYVETVNAADRSAATAFLPQLNAKRERRRTVTDIWPSQ